MVKKRKISGKDFEEYLQPTIRKNFPRHHGWQIEEQKPVGDGIVDWVAFRRPSRGKLNRVVIDAKDKSTLTTNDIDQICYYRGTYKAQLAILYIANDTHVPSSVREDAWDSGVAIRRTQWRC